MTHEQREVLRKKRVLEYAEQTGNIRRACRHYGIARSTFYLWRDRYRERGEAGLTRRNRCPHKHPNKTPDEVVEKILHLRRTVHMARYGSSGTSSATTGSRARMRPYTESVSGMDSIGSRTASDVEPFTRIATRSRFRGTTCRSTRPS